MARNPGDEDQAGFRDNEYFISIDDSLAAKHTSTYSRFANPILTASISLPVLSASKASATITSTQHWVYADATTAEFGLTLPSAATVAGRSYTVKKIDASANVVLLSASSGETVEGSAYVSIISANEALTVASDGVQFHAVGYFSASNLP